MSKYVIGEVIGREGIKHVRKFKNEYERDEWLVREHEQIEYRPITYKEAYHLMKKYPTF